MYESEGIKWQITSWIIYKVEEKITILLIAYTNEQYPVQILPRLAPFKAGLWYGPC